MTRQLYQLMIYDWYADMLAATSAADIQFCGDMIEYLRSKMEACSA